MDCRPGMQRQGIDAQEAAGIVGRVIKYRDSAFISGRDAAVRWLATETVRAYSIAGYVPR